eukprot:2690368-Prymnesium_polylepis.1
MPKSGTQTEASKRAMAEYLIGMAACLGDVLLSGFASIYFEKARAAAAAPPTRARGRVRTARGECDVARAPSRHRAVGVACVRRRGAFRVPAQTLTRSPSPNANPMVTQVLKSKTETYSVWDRNFQLAFWSSIMYTPLMFYDNPENPFAGWTWVTAGCGFVGALGGVLVALSIKRAPPPPRPLFILPGCSSLLLSSPRFRNANTARANA